MWPKYGGLCVYVQRDIKLREICLYGNMYQSFWCRQYTKCDIGLNEMLCKESAEHCGVRISEPFPSLIAVWIVEGLSFPSGVLYAHSFGICQY